MGQSLQTTASGPDTLEATKSGQAGAVLGIDVGFSETRRSSAVCRLAWNERCINWDVRRFRARPSEREDAITAFMGVMLRDPIAVAARRADRSDTFFRHLTGDGTLAALLRHLLPGRGTVQDLDAVTNHDDRAALVCALTALCVAAGDFTAAGDADGWIILPPRRFVQDWAWADLEANMREEASGCLHRTPVFA